MIASNSTIWIVFLTLNAYINYICGKCYILIKCFKKNIFLTLILECTYFCSDRINGPCNMLVYYVVWPFQFMAFRFVIVSVCGLCGLWPFWSPAFSVFGPSYLLPLRFVAVSAMAVSGCGRYDLLPSQVRINKSVYDILRCLVSWTTEISCITSNIKTLETVHHSMRRDIVLDSEWICTQDP